MKHLLLLYCLCFFIRCINTNSLSGSVENSTKPENQILGTWYYNCPVDFIQESFEFTANECKHRVENDFPLHPDDTIAYTTVTYKKWYMNSNTLYLRNNSRGGQSRKDPYPFNKVYTFSFQDNNTLYITEIITSRKSKRKEFIRDTQHYHYKSNLD